MCGPKFCSMKITQDDYAATLNDQQVGMAEMSAKFVVAATRGAASLQKKAYGYNVGDALGDYFFYGYRYYRVRADEARARHLSPAAGPMSPLKIALFLDVDLTITEDTIQSVYSRELGVKDVVRCQK
jgi:hypothetical protein